MGTTKRKLIYSMVSLLTESYFLLLNVVKQALQIGIHSVSSFQVCVIVPWLKENCKLFFRYYFNANLLVYLHQKCPNNYPAQQVFTAISCLFFGDVAPGDAHKF